MSVVLFMVVDNPDGNEKKRKPFRRLADIVDISFQIRNPIMAFTLYRFGLGRFEERVRARRPSGERRRRRPVFDHRREPSAVTRRRILDLRQERPG